MANFSSTEQVNYFAETDARNRRVKFGIKESDRSRHMYVIGKTGMGKSTLLENMAIQDIENGEGLAFIDPHGGTAEKLLDYIPDDRIDDVLYFAPFDMEYPVAFNIIEDVGYDKRHLVVSGMMNAFEKIWADQWSSRMEYILSNTLLALLEYPNSTLLDVNKLLVDKQFRDAVIENVTDPLVKAFWNEEFAKYTDRYTQEATPAIQNKIGQFTSNPVIRNIIGQPYSSFDLREMMDNKKIFIANLSKGRMGETNADLLGSMLITKIYLAAMSRADLSEPQLKALPPFYFYVDEFQSFANKSFADILSESRKYKLSLIMAHQYIEQMSEEVRAAVFGNVGTMITFRVGAYDAESLEREFSPQFTAEDLVNLGFAQIYLKLMINGISSQPFSATTLPPIPPPEKINKEEVVSKSREKFAQLRSQVEEEIKSRRGEGDQNQSKEKEQAENPGAATSERSKGGESRSGAEGKEPRPYKEAPPKESKESMSLEDLKSKLEKRQNKQGGQERKHREESGKDHLEGLRQALTQVLGKSEDQGSGASDSTDTDTAKEQDSEDKKAFGGNTDNTEEVENNNKQQNPAKKEIPEEELRRILDVSEEENSSQGE